MERNVPTIVIHLTLSILAAVGSWNLFEGDNALGLYLLLMAVWLGAHYLSLPRVER